MEGVTAASWHTVRAAVLHELADEYRRWRKAGDKEPDFARALTRQRGRDVRSSRSRRWRRWSGHPRTGALSLEGTDPAGAVVAGTGHGFRDREAEAARRPDVGDGCRPAEIERGVTVRRVQGGIEIEIPGAKVTETKGQPRRKILIDAKSPAGLHLGMALGAKAEIEMSRGQRIGHDFADIRRRTGSLLSAPTRSGIRSVRT